MPGTSILMGRSSTGKAPARRRRRRTDAGRNLGSSPGAHAAVAAIKLDTRRRVCRRGGRGQRPPFLEDCTQGRRARPRRHPAHAAPYVRELGGAGRSPVQPCCRGARDDRSDGAQGVRAPSARAHAGRRAGGFWPWPIGVVSVQITVSPLRSAADRSRRDAGSNRRSET